MRKIFALFLVLALIAGSMTVYAHRDEKPGDKPGRKRGKPTYVFKGPLKKISGKYIVMKVLRANR